MLSWPIISVALATASALTVHRHSIKQECVDLQCPATSIDYGKKSLVNEETLRSEPCRSCHHCTANGYSVCMRTSSSRARRQSLPTECSCAHSVPANCHNELTQIRHPSNLTMQMYTICYLSSLQAPPKPLAVNENDHVIVTVEPFWQEPYWREIELQNLTLHYDYEVNLPEHCEGAVVTNEDENGHSPTHFCTNVLKLEMNNSEKSGNDEYEHSENYDQYDDDLPPEVVIDRDVFMGAKNTKFFFDVEVKRPRQLKIRPASKDVFDDQLTKVESEILKFNLKPEVFGTGIKETHHEPEESSNQTESDNVAPTLSAEKAHVTDDEEDDTEEKEGTDFFADTRKETKSEENEKEEEELDVKVEKEDKEVVEKEHTGEQKEEQPEDKERDLAEMNTEKKDHEQREEQEHKNEVNKKLKEQEQKQEKEMDEKDKQEDNKDVEEGDEGEEEENKNEKADTSKVIDDAVDETEETKPNDDKSHKSEKATQTEEPTENREIEENEEKTTLEEEEEEENDDDDDDDDEVEEEQTEDLGFFQNIRASLVKDKYHLARWVFGVTIVFSLLLICCTCIYRRCGPKKQRLTKNTNGNRYESAPQNTQLESVNVTSCVEELLEINRNELMHRFNSACLQFESIASDRMERSAIIGKGRFGVIHRALHHIYNGSVQDVCAYWVTNPKSLNSSELRSLVHLMEQSAAAGSHQNLICARGILHQNGSTVVILETLSHPDLQSVLRESRCARFGKGQLKSVSFLSTDRLLSMMIGCSLGAKELVHRKIVHPHLCAANVLVGERGQVKISGFGLVEHTALDSRKHERALSPLRWQSPSTILNQSSTTIAEDFVWSIGVLLWEIASLGGTPYPEIRTPDEFIGKIRNRTARLSNPSYVGFGIFSLIDLCCHWNASERPSLAAVIQRLECLAADSSHHLMIQIENGTEPFSYAPICTYLEQKAPQSVYLENN